MAVEVFHIFFRFMMILWMTLLCEEEHDRSWKMGCKHRILSGDAMLILAYQYFEVWASCFYAIGKII
jgi:hypothetical protein